MRAFRAVVVGSSVLGFLVLFPWLGNASVGAQEMAPRGVSVSLLGSPGPVLGITSAVVLDGPGAPVPASGPRRGRGALIGGGIGLVVGGVLGGLTSGSDDDGAGGSLVDAAATAEGVALGAVFGAVVGAVLGATVFAPDGSDGNASDAALSLQTWASDGRLGVRGSLAR